MLAAGELWVTASALLRSQVSDGVWQSTFAQVAPIELSADTFTLAMPNGIIRDRLDGRYRPLVEDAVAEAAGYDLKIVFQLVVPNLGNEEGHGGPQIDLTAEPSQIVGSAVDPTLIPPRVGAVADPGAADQADMLNHLAAGTGQIPTVPLDQGLQPAPAPSTIDLEPANRYTFKNFVTGPSNRFAIAAALSVAERPGGSYNPLFIYGSAGLGKTHILRAIEHFINDLEPQKKVLYVSTETFLNEFVDSIKNSSGNDFKASVSPDRRAPRRRHPIH